MTDPSDEEIEARLRAQPIDRWLALWAAVDDLDVEQEHATWDYGGTPVRHLPWVSYSDALLRVVGALSAAGAFVPFDWPAWDGVARYRTGTGLDDAPVADAVRMATAIVRGDRFSEGTIAGTLDDGTLPAVLRRLRRWFDEERPPDA
ncbi:MAG: hypothetical protein QOE93_2535 [Actinomycetota bacterium]|nr:hypothetical protein [Actinomycetota bacterium]